MILFPTLEKCDFDREFFCIRICWFFLQILQKTNLANNVYFVATQLTTDYSFAWILVFCLADEYNRTKVTRHTNDVYKLFTDVDTSNA